MEYTYNQNRDGSDRDAWFPKSLSWELLDLFAAKARPFYSLNT